MEREAAIDFLGRVEEHALPENVFFRREWWMVMLSLLAWGAFWEIAERHEDNAHAQFLTWLAVVLAWMAVDAV